MKDMDPRDEALIKANARIMELEALLDGCAKKQAEQALALVAIADLAKAALRKSPVNG